MKQRVAGGLPARRHLPVTETKAFCDPSGPVATQILVEVAWNNGRQQPCVLFAEVVAAFGPEPG